MKHIIESTAGQRATDRQARSRRPRLPHYLPAPRRRQIDREVLRRLTQESAR